LAKARELSRRLQFWHVEDTRNPIQMASEEESWGWVRKTYRQILGKLEPSPRPYAIQYFFDWDAPAGGAGKPIGYGYVNPERDTDHSLTRWLMGDFIRHLEAAPPLPALDYLKESFGHILDLPAYTIREPGDDGERALVGMSRDAAGEPRCYIVIGQPIRGEFLETLAEAAEKLLAAAPDGWAAVPHPVPSGEAIGGDAPVASEGGAVGWDAAPVAVRDFRELLDWLKRATPGWPPMGVDWPLVLSAAERIFCRTSAAKGNDCETPQDGQEIADYLRGLLEAEMLQGFDQFSRGYAYACQLIEAFGLLEAFCKASLAVGYDLDAIKAPVDELPPFHVLMSLSQTMLEWIRCLRDGAKQDLAAVTEPSGQTAKLGAAFGRNMHQATWDLADEMCKLADSVCEGRLRVSAMAHQPAGAMEFYWARLCEALEGRFPGAAEAKQARVQLENESRAAFDRAFGQRPASATHDVSPQSDDPLGAILNNPQAAQRSLRERRGRAVADGWRQRLNALEEAWGQRFPQAADLSPGEDHYAAWATRLKRWGDAVRACGWRARKTLRDWQPPAELPPDSLGRRAALFARYIAVRAVDAAVSAAGIEADLRRTCTEETAELLSSLYLPGDWLGRIHSAIEAAVRLHLQQLMRALQGPPEPVHGIQVQESRQASAPSRTDKRPKRSTERGEGRAKLISALTAHHKYADGSCLNQEPIGSNDLARKAEVSESTASAFFAKEFKGHDKYRAMCRDNSSLVAALKILNQDFAPHHLFGRRPPGECEPRDEE
jgi:hypothetical protein